MQVADACFFAGLEDLGLGESVGAVVVEHVQRERTIVGVDVGDHVVDAVVADDGQDRAEDLVLHHLGIVARFQHHGRWQQAFRFGRRGIDIEQGLHAHAARGGVVEIAAQTAVLAGIDDTGVVAEFACIRETLRDIGAQRGDEGVAFGARHEHVVTLAVAEIAERRRDGPDVEPPPP